MNRFFIFYLIYPVMMGVIIYEYRKELLHLLKVKVLNVEVRTDLVVGVMSNRDNFYQRQTIRETWGQRQGIKDRVKLKFVVGKHVCLIHPEDLDDEYDCNHWHVSVPESTEDIPLVSSVSEKKEDEYIYNFGVQRIQFKVQHEVILTHLGVHRSSITHAVKISLLEAQSEIEIVSAHFSKEDSGIQFGDFFYKNVTAFILPKGFEGVLIGKRTDGTTGEMAVPTTRVLTQINNGGGVLHIQQYQPLVSGHYSSTKEWNRPHVNLVSFKFSINDVDKLKIHINETSQRENEWRQKVELEFEKLVEENKEYEDILFVDVIDVYRNIPHKLLHFIEWAVDEVNFDFLLKTDDDAFVDLIGILQSSNLWRNITNLWWGRFRHNWVVEKSGKWAELQYKAPTYPKFACGGGYVIGRDIADWLAKNANQLHKFQGEDVSMGIWLSALAPTYMDDPLWQCEAECISDMNAAPDFHPDAIRTLWNNMQTCEDPCGCD